MLKRLLLVGLVVSFPLQAVVPVEDSIANLLISTFDQSGERVNSRIEIRERKDKEMPAYAEEIPNLRSALMGDSSFEAVFEVTLFSGGEKTKGHLVVDGADKAPDILYLETHKAEVGMIEFRGNTENIVIPYRYDFAFLYLPKENFSVIGVKEDHQFNEEDIYSNSKVKYHKLAMVTVFSNYH